MFAASFAVGLSGAMSPGPLTVVTVSETAKRGIIAPFLIMAGHALLELAATTLLALGLLAVVDRPAVTGSVGLGGGLIMILLAAALFRDALWGRMDMGRKRGGGPAGGPGMRVVGLGIVVSLSNPYWTVWWVTVAAGLLAVAAKSGLVTVAAFYTGHILSDFVYYVALGLAVVAGRRFIGGRAYRAVMALFALLLGAFGVVFLLKGWNMLAG